MAEENASVITETVEAESVIVDPTLFEKTPVNPIVAVTPQPAKEEIAAGMIDETKLNAEERKIVEEYVSKVNITDVSNVINYGSDAQKNISDFSVSVLQKVKTYELGDVGNSLKELTTALTIDEQPSKGFLGIFKKAKSTVASIRANYSKAETNVNRIEKDLREHQSILAADIDMYQKMYDMNLDYYKQLTLYIIAGKEVIEREKTTTLEDLRIKADTTKEQIDIQAYKDYTDLLNRFEKKIADLEITRVISMQTAPQVRMLQNNDRELMEKLQSSLVNTIPLWRNQLVLSLGYAHSQEALSAQTALSDKTNELLKKNSEMLKTASVETAKESERSIVDIETLKTCNENLIASINDVVKVHEEGAKKRANAHNELVKMENDLKQALMNSSTPNRE